MCLSKELSNSSPASEQKNDSLDPQHYEFKPSTDILYKQNMFEQCKQEAFANSPLQKMKDLTKRRYEFCQEWHKTKPNEQLLRNYYEEQAIKCDSDFQTLAKNHPEAYKEYMAM